MIYNFTKEEKKIIKELSDINPENELTNEQEIELIEIVENKLIQDGFIDGIDYKTNKIGDICENIITKLTN